MLLKRTVREPKSVCAPATRPSGRESLADNLMTRNWFPAGRSNAWSEGSTGFVRFSFWERISRRVDVIF
jgi:hypothetical protein